MSTHSKHNLRAAIQVERGYLKKNAEHKKNLASESGWWKKKVKNTKPNSISFSLSLVIQALCSRDKEEGAGKEEKGELNSRRKSGIFRMVYMQQFYRQYWQC